MATAVIFIGIWYIGADVYLDDELTRKGREYVVEDLKGLNP